MDWITAHQLAGEIAEIVGLDKITVSQQEQIAFKLVERDGQSFSSRFQTWTKNIHPVSIPRGKKLCQKCNGLGQLKRRKNVYQCKYCQGRGWNEA